MQRLHSLHTNVATAAADAAPYHFCHLLSLTPPFVCLFICSLTRQLIVMDGFFLKFGELVSYGSEMN